MSTDPQDGGQLDGGQPRLDGGAAVVDGGDQADAGRFVDAGRNMDGGASDGGASDGGRPALPGEMGGACDGNNDCMFQGGVCHLDAWQTPKGMCTRFCMAVDDPVCASTPRPSRCGLQPGSQTGACFLQCDQDSECRMADGYRCCNHLCIPQAWCP